MKLMLQHKDSAGSGYKPFSSFWWSIAQTRLVLCLIIFAFTYGNPNIPDSFTVYIVIAIYVAFQVTLGFFNSDFLKLVTVRVIPSFIDIFFISLIVSSTGGPNSTWFLIYIFPIISVSKYLGGKGSLLLCGGVIITYTILNYLIPSGASLDLRTFVFRCLFFLATAFLAGNLARTKQKNEIQLIENFAEINNEILSDISASTQKAFGMILRRAMDITNSEMGHIRLVDHQSPARDLELVVAFGHPRNYNWDLRPMDDSLSRKAANLKSPLIIQSIRKRQLINYLGVYFRLHRPRPKSALFVPLLIKDEVTGVLAVYSHRRYHYIKRDAKMVGGLAPLVTVALKTKEFNKELSSALKELNLALEENRRRLDLLYEIGSQLGAGLPLNDLFQKVVELIYEHLKSEEAALFIPEEYDPKRIRKVAVKGPTEEITGRLESVELSYAEGESLAGKIFKTREPIFLEEVAPIVDYVDDYIKILPSKKILHYVGVPLIIGSEILGVIRVINKRGAGYSAESNPELSPVGFEESEDVGLLKTIAIQVAVAIKYTRVLKEEKLAAIGKMAASTGHDIKSNLGTVLNYIDTLKSLCDQEADADKLEMYTDMEDALWEAKNLIQNMLMSVSPRQTKKEAVHIGDVFSDFEEKLRREAEAAQVDFSLDYPVDNHELLIDVSQIRQVFANLANNSIDAVRAKASSTPGFRGRIEVTARVTHECLLIYWRDNGAGMSKRSLRNLFTPFYTTKTKTGNGLGLYISKAIVENHMGTIAAASEEGEGTVFTIELPLLQNDGTGERDASNPAA